MLHVCSCVHFVVFSWVWLMCLVLEKCLCMCGVCWESVGVLIVFVLPLYFRWLN